MKNFTFDDDESQESSSTHLSRLTFFGQNNFPFQSIPQQKELNNQRKEANICSAPSRLETISSASNFQQATTSSNIVNISVDESACDEQDILNNHVVKFS